MDLLLDTHTLVWLSCDDRKLSGRARSLLTKPDSRICVSAVTAWEFEDLALRGRFPGIARFAPLVEVFDIVLLNIPADLWELAHTLPQLHRDPVDRMLIAHAIHADLTLVTADRIMRDYPVKSIW